MTCVREREIYLGVKRDGRLGRRVVRRSGRSDKEEGEVARSGKRGTVGPSRNAVFRLVWRSTNWGRGLERNENPGPSTTGRVVVHGQWQNKGATRAGVPERETVRTTGLTGRVGKSDEEKVKVQMEDKESLRKGLERRPHLGG